MLPSFSDFWGILLALILAVTPFAVLYHLVAHGLP